MDFLYLCTIIMATKKLKHQYIQGLGIVIMVLALVRCVFPGIGTSRQQEAPLASHRRHEERPCSTG